jgi:hypothetical protein
MKCSLLALSSYLDDELDVAHRAEVEAHLVGCERCRKGLDYLREETDRFGALGRVHVPDSAIHAFMEQLGLLGPGDPLPPRPAPPPPAPRDVLPWQGVAGTGSGHGLPWTPRADTAEPPGANQPTLPFTDSLTLPGVSPLTSAAGWPAGSAEIHLNGQAAPTPPRATPDPIPLDPGPGSGDGWPLESVALEGVAIRRIGHAAIAAPIPRSDPGAAAQEGEPAPGDVAPVGPRLPADPGDGGRTASAPRAAFSPSSPALPPAPSLPPAPAPPLPPPPPLPAAPPAAAPPRPTAAALWPAPSTAPPPVSRAGGDDDPWSWAPRDDAPSLAEVDGRSTAGSYGVEAGLRDPDPDIPDPLVDPLIDRVARPPRPLGPPQLVRPTLISRLRDQVALRLALMRGVGAAADAGEEDDNDVAAPAHSGPPPPESVGPVVAAMRARMDPPGTEQHATWMGEGPARHTSGWGAGASWGDLPADPTSAEEIPRPAGPSRVLELDRGPRPTGRHSRRLGGRHAALGSGGGLGAPAGGGLGDLPERVRRLGERPGRVWVAVAGLAILVLMVSLLVSHAGAGGVGGVAAAGATAHPAPAVSLAPQAQPSSSIGTSASAAPSVSPSVAATPVPTPVVASQTYGAGGAGWQLDDLRCCDVEAGSGYTRIVFDLAGSTGANPTATVTFPTPTTMVVTFPSVDAPASISVAGSGGLVTGVTRQSGSSLAFRLALSKAATVQDYEYLPGSDAESSAPLHLYFDLG